MVTKRMLRALSGGLFMAMVFFAAGDWFLGINESAGLLTMMMGFVTLVFLLVTLFALPRDGRGTRPSLD